MKKSKLSISPLPILAAILIIGSIAAGAFLQSLTLRHSKKLAETVHSQLVLIQAIKVAGLLNDTAGAMMYFGMTRNPKFAEKFNKANTELPKALDDLGNLGPFEGQQAEAVSQFKQLVSESMGAIAKSREALSAGEASGADMGQRRQNFMMFKTLRENGEKIHDCLVRLEPMGGTANCLKEQEEMNKEADQLKLATALWLPISVILTVIMLVALARKLRAPLTT
ncbi:MAG: CHASE3 domain-containing protein [Cyanobacteria bacterium SZAS LIN-3]|nr:CHASE3 domain-containing protein [Cyanobacteria bacterium SZAS LIN-3]